MMDFLQDIGLFDPTKAETGTPLYENMVLMVQRSNLSAKILTVGLVQNLAKLVVVANINKWQQIVPSDRLKKIEFVHLLGFICDRNLKIENVAPGPLDGSSGLACSLICTTESSAKHLFLIRKVQILSLKINFVTLRVIKTSWAMPI